MVAIRIIHQHFEETIMQRILVTLFTFGLYFLIGGDTACAQLAGTTADITSLSATVSSPEPGFEQIVATAGGACAVDSGETLTYHAKFSLEISDFSGATIGSDTGTGVDLAPGESHSWSVSLTTSAIYGSGPYTVNAFVTSIATEDQMEFFIVADEDSIIVL
jgi:hypothetical protein